MEFERIPEAFRPLAEQRWHALGLDASMLSPALRETLPSVFAWSAFVANRLKAEPELLTGTWGEQLALELSPQVLQQHVHAALDSANDESSLMRALRQVRTAMLARIAWRDIAGWASVEETLLAASRVADACVAGALDRLHAWHREKHGEALDSRGQAQQLTVIGMGKLGGSELNFSSDIDLIFSFPESGHSDGARPLANEQYFTRLGQQLIRVLHETTADGFAYRVDMRLRPFGDSGPLVMTFNGVESYYEQHGREWERYAFIKARPVAGDLAAGDALLRRLQPFVYRRYLDFSVFDSLREMKAGINREVRRRELRDDVKLGSGGIREAEFVVQLFQLIRGGREPSLRERSFPQALAAASELQCLSDNDEQVLLVAYRFLRKLENRLQEEADQQVHAVPEEAPDRERLAFSLGFADVNAFETAWRDHRAAVRRLFDDAFLGPEPEPQAEPLAQAWNDPGESTALLERVGFGDAGSVVETLEALQRRVERQPPGTQGVQRLNKLMPRVLATAAKQAEPEVALARMLKLIEAVLGRTTYLALLLENPRALNQLARICAASDWIAQLVARHPLLLDELIDPRLFEQVPDRESLEEELVSQLSRRDPGDLEGVMDALREFQQVSVMRIAAADISRVLPLMKVSDRLTDVAELVIRSILEPAEDHLVARHGRPLYRIDGESSLARFLVVGYGKLGGLELGYGSDLDLVFLHDSHGEDQHTDGERAVDNSLFFLRLTQRIIHFLSTPTPAGVLYEVDTRLRPSGQAGLLVSSMEAFTRYQREEAWTWEHQALLRARPIAGDEELALAFEHVRRETLARERNVETLRRDVVEMRNRMRSGKDAQRGQFDVKAGFGGITDIEFMVQYWVLREAHAAPDLLRFTDTIRFIEGLESSGRVAKERLAGLADAYRELRAAAHALALQGRPSVVSVDACLASRQCVQAAWVAEFGDIDPADLATDRLI